MIILMTFKNVFPKFTLLIFIHACLDGLKKKKKISLLTEIDTDFNIKRFFFNLNYKLFLYPGSMLYCLNPLILIL